MKNIGEFFDLMNIFRCGRLGGCAAASIACLALPAHGVKVCVFDACGALPSPA